MPSSSVRLTYNFSLNYYIELKRLSGSADPFVYMSTGSREEECDRIT
jgi:hypothetical protein